MIVNGTKATCPSCGDGIELTITLGQTERHGDHVEVAVGFDETDFEQRFEAHVLTDPSTHPQFVTRR